MKRLASSFLALSAFLTVSIAHAGAESMSLDLAIVDQDYDIQFMVPESMFQEREMSDSANSEFKALLSNDESLRIYCASSGPKADIENEYLLHQKRPNAVVTYKTIKQRWFVVSGTEGKSGIFYTKGILAKAGSVVALTVEYDQKDKSRFDPLVAQIMKSFSLRRTGPATASEYFESFLRFKYGNSKADAIMAYPVRERDDKNGYAEYAMDHAGDSYTFVLWHKSDGGKLFGITTPSAEPDIGQTSFWSYDTKTWSELHNIIPPIDLKDFWDEGKPLDPDMNNYVRFQLQLPRKGTAIKVWLMPNYNSEAESRMANTIIQQAQRQTFDLLWDKKSGEFIKAIRSVK